MSPFTPRGGVIGTPVEGIGDVPGLTAALAALQEAATAATDTELSDAAATLQTAIDTKQGAATAATDTELTAAMATVQLAATAATDSELSALSASVTTALGLKADASSVATDAELAAAVATLNTAVGLKQDASTAATDTELANVADTLSAAIAAIPSGDVALFAEEPVSPADGQAWLEAAGGEWLSGTAAPTADDGHDGDFYWRSTTGEVYGPKTAGAWPATVVVLDLAAITAKSVADRAYAVRVGGKPGLRIAGGGGAVPVAGRTWHPNSGASAGVNEKVNSCFVHTARFSTMGLRLVYANYLANDGDVLSSQAITVRAALETTAIAGTRVLAYFGGKRDVVIEPGGIVVSDMLAPTLVEGQAFRVWTFATPAAGGTVPLSQVMPNLGTINNNDGQERSTTAVDKTNAVLHAFTATGASGATSLTAVSGLTQAIDNGSVLVNVLGVAGVPNGATITWTGATTATLSTPLTAAITGATLFAQPIAGPSVAESSYQPVAILGYPAAATPVVAGYGDSITVGTGDDHTDIDGTHWGYFERTFAGTGWSRLNISRAGEFIQTAIKGRMRRTLLDGVTHIWEGYGSNDVAVEGNGGATVATPIKAKKITLWTELSYTGANVYSMTICPRTNTGSFSSQTRQVRADLNSWMRDGAPISAGAAVAVGTVGAARCAVYNASGTKVVTASGAHPLTAIFDPQTTVETTVDSNVWITGTSDDATHPNATGAAALATALRLNLALFTV